MNRNELYYDLLKSLIIAAVVQFFNRFVFSRFSLESIALIQALLIMVFTVSCYIVLDHLIKTDKGKMISKIVILIVVLATSIASYLLISKFILQLDDGTAVYIGKLNEQYKTHMIESGKTMLEMWKSFDHNQIFNDISFYRGLIDYSVLCLSISFSLLLSITVFPYNNGQSKK